MKRYLIAGLLVWVPLGITIWVLYFLVSTLDQTLLLVPESAPATASSGDPKSETRTTAKPASSESTTASSETKSSAATTPAKPAATGS